ncbi:MAG: hypothetical protein Q8L81_09080 [Bacteroidota bacterium]|nr:hypothetical protein [Bacteroidota bacterium]
MRAKGKQMNKFLHILIKLEVGDRIVVPKSTWDLIQHHAIYLGYWNNQYWFIENKEGYGVRIVCADVFFAGVNKVTRINKFTPRYNYSRNDLYNYALTKQGRRYDLLKYNCEHLSNELQHHVVKSKQASTGLGLGLLALGLFIAGVASESNNNKSKNY